VQFLGSIINPLLFVETVNADYHSILVHFITLLQDDKKYSWFQQDRTTCHNAQTSVAILQEFFRDWLTRAVAPQNPQPPSADFVLWGHLKRCL
jgi:hypothetical protein